MENIKVNGITLNQQLIDLLAIVDDVEGVEQQDIKIKEYIENLRQTCDGVKKQGPAFILGKIVNSLPEGDSQFKSQLLNFYASQNNESLDICDSGKVINGLYNLLKNRGFSETDCSNLHRSILVKLRDIDTYAKPGILEMNPEDIRNLHSHLFDENGKCRYDRITMDTCGRFSDAVSIDGKTFCDGHLERATQFAKKHGIKTKINTLMMYCDFPMIYNSFLNKKIERGEITEEDRKKELKDSLMRYVIEIGTRYGNQISAVDIFNELIYNTGATEKPEIFGEYELDENGERREKGFSERKSGWQKYLDLDDLCEMAVVARSVLPNATFTYNDWNWVNPEKRQAMIEIVKRIKEKEKDLIEAGGIYVSPEIKKLLVDKKIMKEDDQKLVFGQNQTIIDNIGFEAHLSTTTQPEELEASIIEVLEKTGLPGEITEIDVAFERDTRGNKQLKKVLIAKQMALFKKADEMIKKGIIIGQTIWSLGKSSFTDELYGYTTHASKLNDEFKSKVAEDRRKTVSYFHDQKSEYALEQINSGKESLGFSDSITPKKSETPIFTEREIGKATVYTPLEQKQGAERVGARDMREVAQMQVHDKKSNNSFPEGHDE